MVFVKGCLKSSDSARCHRRFVAPPESGGGIPLQITLSQHDTPEFLEVKIHSGFIPSMMVFRSGNSQNMLFFTSRLKEGVCICIFIVTVRSRKRTSITFSINIYDYLYIYIYMILHVHRICAYTHVYILYIIVEFHPDIAQYYFSALVPLVPQHVLQPFKGKKGIRLIKPPTVLANLWCIATICLTLLFSIQPKTSKKTPR